MKEKNKTFTLKNEYCRANFISFGARITNFIYKGTDVLLGYDLADDYLSDSLFIGATVGRFAGRIGNTKLNLNSSVVQLDQNENETTCHHGGYNAFDKRYWEGSQISDHQILFTRTSQDGEGGFPGNLEISVLYTLLENGLEICHTAKTDKVTPINLTNHAYFNLSGYDHDDARTQLLMIPAKHYLPLNEKLIPTGEICETKGTKFDFTTMRTIGTDLDHYFVYEKSEGFRYGGTLYSPLTKIRMDIETDQPGIQIYTCGAFEAERGKGGIPLHRNQGIALETQGYPDNPNHENFPSSLLYPGETFISKTRFIFSNE